MDGNKRLEIDREVYQPILYPNWIVEADQNTLSSLLRTLDMEGSVLLPLSLLQWARPSIQIDLPYHETRRILERHVNGVNQEKLEWSPKFPSWELPAADIQNQYQRLKCLHQPGRSVVSCYCLKLEWIWIWDHQKERVKAPSFIEWSKQLGLCSW